MHPRKLLCPLLDTVFHVTNKGCSSSALLRPNKEVLELELMELAGVALPDPLLPLFAEDFPELVDGRLLLDEVAD